MEPWSVRLGEEETEGAAYDPYLGFSSSLLHKYAPINQPVLLLRDAKSLEQPMYSDLDCFIVCANETRDREEAREPGGFLHFLRELPISCTSLSIEDVRFISMEELSALCSGIGSPICILSELLIDRRTSITDDDLAQQHILVKDVLFKNTSLTTLFLNISHASLIMSPQECLIPALTRPTPRPSTIKKLSLCNWHGEGRGGLFDLSTIVKGLACNTISLTHFHLYKFPIDQHLGTMLHSNTSLQFLCLCHFNLPGQFVKLLFASLEHNAHLTSLSLFGCHGPDWPSASFVLDSLRANGIVSSLDLRDTPLMGESEAVIEAQLARNKQRAEQLRLEGSVLVPPKTVRLFLCGLPFSGKTTLSRSLVKWNTKDCCQDRICLRPCAPAIMPGRTRGIEVSNLEKDGVTVSLWDMAGQEHYYAFHDHMFPNLSDDAAPSIFLFVWNPVQLDKETNKESRDDRGENSIKTPDMFEDEFRYWLRFIASKTLESLEFKPYLLVAITRADLLKIPATTLIRSSFTRCQKDFEARVQFGMDGVFEINARDPCDAEDLGLRIFQCATSILKEKPAAYQACNHARIALPELVLAKRLAPLITKEEFFYVCTKHLGIRDQEMQEAVGLSLNESGDLIYFKELELVVIDVRWFCHELMGNLLYSCHMNLKQHQHRGFFTLEFLESFLESTAKYSSTTSRASQLKAYITIFAKHLQIVSKIKGKLDLPPIRSKIKGKDLVKLLIGLQLACQQGDGDHLHVFIPASLCTESGRQVDPRGYLLGSDDDENMQTFLGRRLKCKDSICTFFTPGIFTLLQAAFHDILKKFIILDEDVIAFSQSGVKVLIEFCKHVGQDHFIDVLIHSRLDLDNTIAWASEEVLDKMETICAQPRGIQGVELVRQVIRPRSVKECILMEDRRCAAVSVEELQKALRHALEKRGTGQPDCLNTVFHNWNPGSDSDRIVDLLGNMETLEVVKKYRQMFVLDVENVLGINAEEELVCSTSTSEPRRKVFSSTNSGKEREWIYHEVQEARKDIQKVQEEISKVLAEVQKIGDVVLPQIRQKVQELLTFAKDGEAGKLPRLFVVTKDDASSVRKIVGAMIPGLKNVRLELLCEHRVRPHLVAEQCGIRFATLEDGLLKQGLPYIYMFLKLASMAVKVAAHVTSGLGNAIPDFSHVLSTILDTTASQSLQIHVDSQAPSASRTNFQESQRWLFHVLSEHECITSMRIHEVFGLQRVRYSNSQVAWLCDKHCSEGQLCF